MEKTCPNLKHASPQRDIEEQCVHKFSLTIVLFWVMSKHVGLGASGMAIIVLLEHEVLSQSTFSLKWPRFMLVVLARHVIAQEFS